MNGFKLETTCVGQYLDDVQNETTKTDQAVQRDFCWTNESMNNLIYSATSQKIFVPNLILAEEDKDGVIVSYVVDGGNRTEVLRRFKYCSYKVTSKIRNPIITYNKKKLDENGKIMRDEYGDVVWETCEFDLRGKTYDDMPKELQRKFDKCPLATTIYQDCTPGETSELVNLYNNHVPMNVSQKALTYIGHYANEIKRIKESSRFLKDGTALTETEKHKGIWERIISECVMTVFHIDDWKKNPQRMCEYLNDNSCIEEFTKIEEFFDRIGTYSDKLDNREVSKLFTPKDICVWLAVFNNFNKYGLDDSKFGEFLNKFVANMEDTLINDISWEDLCINKNTKDKSIIEQKINHITYLMEEYLHINKEEIVEDTIEIIEEVASETENNIKSSDNKVTNNNESEQNTGCDDEILSFVKENVADDIEDIDIKEYQDFVDVYLKIDNPLYIQCKAALIALTAYAYRTEKDVELATWLENYQKNTNAIDKNYSPSQDVNYKYIKMNFDNYINFLNNSKRGEIVNA